jgi:hypothetical protein
VRVRTEPDVVIDEAVLVEYLVEKAGELVVCRTKSPTTGDDGATIASRKLCLQNQPWLTPPPGTGSLAVT